MVAEPDVPGDGLVASAPLGRLDIREGFEARDDEELGGGPVCLAHLLCLGCGLVLDSEMHRPGCAATDGR
jgi:hypothetical protein